MGVDFGRRAGGAGRREGADIYPGKQRQRASWNYCSSVAVRFSSLPILLDFIGRQVVSCRAA